MGIQYWMDDLMGFHGVIYNPIWLVVSTPLTNISQMGVLFPIYKYGKIKTFPNHQQVIIIIIIILNDPI